MRYLLEDGRGGGGGMLGATATMLVQTAILRHAGEILHKNLLPLSWGDSAGLALASVALLVAAGGGIGGGALLVPILIVIMGDSSAASVLSFGSKTMGQVSALLQATDGRDCHMPQICCISTHDPSRFLTGYASAEALLPCCHVDTAGFRPNNAVALSNVCIVGGDCAACLDCTAGLFYTTVAS